jgi:hypothetical protein
LRTWNRELFLKIRIDDVFIKNNGINEFPKMSGDLSVLLYLCELCPSKCQYISDVLYIYNKTNIISDDKIDAKLQEKTAKYFFDKKKYSPDMMNSNHHDEILNLISYLNMGNFKLKLISKYLLWEENKIELIKTKQIFSPPFLVEEHKNANICFSQNHMYSWIDYFDINKLLYIDFVKNKKLENLNSDMINILYKNIDYPLAIIILSCQKKLDSAINKLIYIKSKNNKNIIPKIFIGTTDDEGLQKIKLMEKFKENEKDIVILNVKDCYCYLSLKVSLSIKYFINNYKINYIFKTDDDIQIDIEKLFELYTKKIKNKIIYAGNCARYEPHYDANHKKNVTYVIIQIYMWI